MVAHGPLGTMVDHCTHLQKQARPELHHHQPAACVCQAACYSSGLVDTRIPADTLCLIGTPPPCRTLSRLGAVDMVIEPFTKPRQQAMAKRQRH